MAVPGYSYERLSRDDFVITGAAHELRRSGEIISATVPVLGVPERDQKFMWVSESGCRQDYLLSFFQMQ